MPHIYIKTSSIYISPTVYKLMNILSLWLLAAGQDICVCGDSIPMACNKVHTFTFGPDGIIYVGVTVDETDRHGCIRWLYKVCNLVRDSTSHTSYFSTEKSKSLNLDWDILQIHDQLTLSKWKSGTFVNFWTL